MSSNLSEAIFQNATGVFWESEPLTLSWIAQFFVVWGSAVLLSVLWSFISKGLIACTKKTSNVWDDGLSYAVKTPVYFVVWSFAITFTVILIFGYEALGIDFRLLQVIAVIVTVSWIMIRLVSQTEIIALNNNDTKGLEKRQNGVMTIAKFIRLFLILLTAFFLMQIVGTNVNTLLTLGGVGALAVGLAARDMLSNIFGGILIYQDAPFDRGDWICSPDRDIEGIVEYIGWRTTRIRRFNTRVITVPNSIFQTVVLENPSRMYCRKINNVISLKASDSPVVHRIRRAIEKYLKRHDMIDQKRGVFVYLEELTGQSLTMRVMCYLTSKDFVEFNDTRHQILLKIMNEILPAYGAGLYHRHISVAMVEPEHVDFSSSGTTVVSDEQDFSIESY